MWQPEVNVEYLSPSLSPLFFLNQGLSLSSELTDTARLSGQ